MFYTSRSLVKRQTVPVLYIYEFLHVYLSVFLGKTFCLWAGWTQTQTHMYARAHTHTFWQKLLSIQSMKRVKSFRYQLLSRTIYPYYSDSEDSQFLPYSYRPSSLSSPGQFRVSKILHVEGLREKCVSLLQYLVSYSKFNKGMRPCVSVTFFLWNCICSPHSHFMHFPFHLCWRPCPTFPLYPHFPCCTEVCGLAYYLSHLEWFKEPFLKTPLLVLVPA